MMLGSTFRPGRQEDDTKPSRWQEIETLYHAAADRDPAGHQGSDGIDAVLNCIGGEARTAGERELRARHCE